MGPEVHVEKKLISIGEIVKPVGLHGEVKVFPLTDFPDRFNNMRDVIVRTKEGRTYQYQIEKARFRHPAVYIYFAGVTSLEEARTLVGGLIQAPEEERVPLPEGSYYQYELEGLDVYLEEGRYLGKVADIIQTGSNDVYVVRWEGKEFLIPALKSVVRNISLSERRMIIHPIEGLLD